MLYAAATTDAATAVYFKIHNRHSAKLMMNRNIIFFSHCSAGFICLDFYWQRRIRKLRVSIIIISNVIMIVCVFVRSSSVEFTPFSSILRACMPHNIWSTFIQKEEIPLSNIRDIPYLYGNDVLYCRHIRRGCGAHRRCVALQVIYI